MFAFRLDFRVSVPMVAVNARSALLAVGVLIVLVCGGCSTATSYHPIDPSTIAKRSLALLYLPTEREVYLQVAEGGSRHARPEINMESRALGQSAIASLGSLTGTAVAYAPNISAFAIDPYALVVSAIAAPVVDAAITASRYAQARDAVERFNEILPVADGYRQQLSQIERAINASAELRLEATTVVTYDDDAFDDNAYMASVNTDIVLVVASLVAFSPRFEILEVTLAYGVYDVVSSVHEPIFRNVVIVQSRVHGGALGDDTRTELEDPVRAWVEREFELIDRQQNLSKHDRKVLREQVEHQARVKVSLRERGYRMYDEHDKEGDIWYADGGARFHAALVAGQREAARLMVHDLLTSKLPSKAERVEPPGYQHKMYRVPSMDDGDRVVYRYETGALVSIDAKSRFVPP